MGARGTRGLALIAGLLVACGGEPQHDEAEGHAHTDLPRREMPEGAGAPLFNDLGSFQRKVATASEQAQRYFDQGLILAYGFNHSEALRSFKEAVRLDPTCAMCWWGQAYSLGPNINKPMDPADSPAAFEAAQKAVAAAQTPIEQALAGAMAARYAADAAADRAALDAAYAEAMRKVAAGHPDDDDVQTLFAESVMDTMPWAYYVDAATPKRETTELVAALERVLARTPEHPGALHFYIHAVEASSTPERAEPAADRLLDLVPGAGHLVHMPSHIYLRVGRYRDASDVNERAAAADESYITQCKAQGFYPAAYYPHNLHFLFASAAFEGRSEVSIGAARKLASHMTPDVLEAVPISEEFVPMEAFALVRFGRWQDVLALPAPAAELRYATGVRHYVRGLAQAATGRVEPAREELRGLTAVAAEPALATVFASGSSGVQLLGIAAKVLEGRIAGSAGDWSAAVAPLRQAVEMQDALPYTEPPPWYFPTREALGQALLNAGAAQEAEVIYRKQLELTPRNGWSLHGLVASLRAQGKTEEATQTEDKLMAVWQGADVKLVGSVF